MPVRRQYEVALELHQQITQTLDDGFIPMSTKSIARLSFTSEREGTKVIVNNSNVLQNMEKAVIIEVRGPPTRVFCV